MRAVLTSPARDPYNMITKMGLPGFWGVKNNNVSDLESGLPGQADISEIYQADGGDQQSK